MRTPEGWEIDLHRNIAHGPWGALIDPETLWGPRVSFALGGRTLPTLGPEAQLAHAVVHAGLGSAVPRWANLRDIAQLSAAPELDRARVLRLLDRSDDAVEWSAELGPLGHRLGVCHRRWLEAP